MVLGLQSQSGHIVRARGIGPSHRQAGEGPAVASGVARHHQERRGLLRAHVCGPPPSGRSSQEDGLESPLTELGLIKPIGRRDGFRFVRGPKPSLGVGAFCYAVTDFWNTRFPNANTLSFEALAHEPGSPGRVFLLDENDVVDMLTALEDVTKGAYRWSETAGLKQLIRSEVMSTASAIDLAAADYSSVKKRSAA